MTLYDNFISAPWHDDRSAYADAYNAAFLHWFLIVLACGGARVLHLSPERMYEKA